VDSKLNKTKKFSKILVAIDGSEQSAIASDCAILMAKKYGSELIVLHVMLSGTMLVDIHPPPHLNKVKKAAQEYFNKIERKVIENNMDIRLKTEIIASPSIVDGIVSFAEKENVDLIIIGTKGESAIKKFLLGSVSSGVVTYAHCTVMVVR
jgi:nucleotide-binding universal stress UspA family protein